MQSQSSSITKGRFRLFDRPYSYLTLVFLGVSLLYYFPFLLGARYTYLTILDNLDNDVAYSSVIGLFYTHPAEARHLLLGGALPIWGLQKLTWPLSLLNLAGNPLLSYFLTDVIVRIVAVSGMYILARRLGVGRAPAVLSAILFGTTLTYTNFGLSIAGVPFVLYLGQKDAEAQTSRLDYIWLFLIGWNSLLAQCGIFVIIGVPILRHLLFGKEKRHVLRTVVAYGAGLAAGSIGLFFVIASRVPTQRDAWLLQGEGILRTLLMFLGNQFNVVGWHYFHASTPLVFVYLATIGAFLATRDKTLSGLLLLIVFCDVWYCLFAYDPVVKWQNHVGGLVKTFGFDRFFFLASVLIILAWIVAIRVSPARFQRLLTLCICLQMATTIVLTPHLRGLVWKSKLTPPSFNTFHEYFKQADYQSAKVIIGDAVTISVGVDPMAAVTSHIATLDGYYPVYPLSYKMSFRHIIDRQLDVSGKKDYFDHWGSRLSTFSDKSTNLSLDYCAAYSMGARFVISGYDLSDSRLRLNMETSPHHLRIYSINSCEIQISLPAGGE